MFLKSLRFFLFLPSDLVAVMKVDRIDECEDDTHPDYDVNDSKNFSSIRLWGEISKTNGGKRNE